MDRRRALLVAGAAASAASSGPMVLPAATRAGIAFVAGTHSGSAALSPRQPLATLAARAYRSTGRTFSTSRQESSRWDMIKMVEKVKGRVAKNHSLAMLKIEKNRADMSVDLYNFFHDKMWKSFGVVSALCSASISVSYILNDQRISVSEENMSRRAEGHDREIKLLWAQLDKLKDSFSSQDEVLFYTVRADQVSEGSHIVINDIPCKVTVVEELTVEDKVMSKFVCSDIFKGQHLEIMLPNNYLIKVPFVTVKEYSLVDTNLDGLYVTIREEAGEKILRAPPAMIGTLSEMQEKKVFVTVTSAMGKDVITSVREVPEGPSLWAWVAGFFRKEE